jgi:transcriptional regulator with XRE-family HTH domain
MKRPYYENIASWRRGANLEQKQVAAFIGVTQSQYSRLETGKSNMTVKQLISIARLLNVHPKNFFD